MTDVELKHANTLREEHIKRCYDAAIRLVKENVKRRGKSLKDEDWVKLFEIETQIALRLSELGYQ